MSGDSLLEFDYVIIGNGAAGVGGVEGIRKLDPKGTIAVVGDETVLPYSRCFLTGYISGRNSEKSLTYRPSGFYERNNAQLLLGQRAANLDTKEKKVVLDDGTQLRFGKLLLATGSSAVLPELTGIGLPGVYVLRTAKDAQAISLEAKGARKAVIMGGGLVGIGAAIALHNRGLEVHLVVASHQVLSQNLDQRAAEMVANHLRLHGVDIQLDLDVVEVLGRDRVRGVRLSDGTILDCDILVSAKGVRMNSDLAVSAGIIVRRGVAVDDWMRSSAPSVYAAGDVAEVKDFISGINATFTLWPIASEQGRVAGYNMAGGDQAYQGGVHITAVEFLGMPLVSIGDTRDLKHPSDLEERLEISSDGGSYRKSVLKEGKVIGAILVALLGEQKSLTNVPCTRIDPRLIRELLLKGSMDFDKLANTLLMEVSPVHPP
ncbi:MAG: FAD-dependent oxidoreductase [Methanomassiliicoccales archaeon]|nr:FAD-dependent oxidoreductase [Methanomassiliicoccales archaeon]